MNIPVPVFVACDETSLKVKCVEQKGAGPKDSFPPAGYRLELEYKEAHIESWDGAKSLNVCDMLANREVISLGWWGTIAREVPYIALVMLYHVPYSQSHAITTTY